jgi:hypothetical protein
MSGAPKKSPFSKIGTIKVQNGKYEQNGREVIKWHQIGVLFGTPHHSKLFIKFEATANGPGNVASVFYDESKAPREADK